jgi:hypothetical protein
MAFSTDRVRLPHATLRPLVPAPGIGPRPSRHPPWGAPHQGVPEAPCATGHHPAPQGTDRTGGWGRAAGAAGRGGWSVVPELCLRRSVVRSCDPPQLQGQRHTMYGAYWRIRWAWEESPVTGTGGVSAGAGVML